MQLNGLCLAALSLSSALAAQQTGDLKVVISFKDTVSTALLTEYGIRPEKSVFGAEAVVARLQPSIVARLRREALIDAVEIDHVASAYGPGNGGGNGPGGGGGGGGGGGPGGGGTSQPPQTTPYGITRVGGAAAAAAGNVTVAVIDTGCDLDHPDLVNNIVGGFNFVKSGAPEDDNGHGTHCSGTIAASDNAIGVVGVAHDAQLLAVKVLDRRGSGSYSDIVSGINWSVANGADIISMSLGGSASLSTLQNACNSAANSCLVIAAAGNDGDCDPNTNEINYPAYYASVVSVGATNADPQYPMDAVMCFTSSNPDVELAAPGYNVNSTWKGDAYRQISGTSMSCPHVSGCAAVLWNGSPGSVKNTLTSTADDVWQPGRDNFTGWGVAHH